MRNAGWTSCGGKWIRFTSALVPIVVPNARVTQIERTERLRLNSPRSESFSNPPENWRQITHQAKADRAAGGWQINPPSNQ